MLEKPAKNCIPWERPHARTGEECQDEGVIEASFRSLLPSPFAAWGNRGRRAGNKGVKLSLGRKRGRAKVF